MPRSRQCPMKAQRRLRLVLPHTGRATYLRSPARSPVAGVTAVARRASSLDRSVATGASYVCRWPCFTKRLEHDPREQLRFGQFEQADVVTGKTMHRQRSFVKFAPAQQIFLLSAAEPSLTNRCIGT